MNFATVGPIHLKLKPRGAILNVNLDHHMQDPCWWLTTSGWTRLVSGAFKVRPDVTINGKVSLD